MWLHHALSSALHGNAAQEDRALKPSKMVHERVLSRASLSDCADDADESLDCIEPATTTKEAAAPVHTIAGQVQHQDSSQQGNGASQPADTEHAAEIADGKLNVTADDLHRELLDAAALWLDWPSLQLLAGVMRITMMDKDQHTDCAALLLELLQRMPALQTLDVLDAQQLMAGVSHGEAQFHTDAQPECAAAWPSRQGVAPSPRDDALWLSSHRLECASWLEAHCPGMRGLTRSLQQDVQRWHSAAMRAEPWSELPAPFCGVSAAERLLLSAMIQPSCLAACLRWLAPVKAAALRHISSTGRVLLSMQEPAAALPVLLHAARPTNAVTEVQLLASMRASGTAHLELCANDALSAMLPASGPRSAAESEDASESIPVHTLHLHAETEPGHVDELVHSKATERVWLLLNTAHLNAAAVEAALTALQTAQRSGPCHPSFRLLLFCPTMALDAIPLRAQMQQVALGNSHAVVPRVVQLLHTADLPAAQSAQLLARNAEMLPEQQVHFQKLWLGLCIAAAAAEEHTRKQESLLLDGNLQIATQAPAMVHCLKLLRAHVTADAQAHCADVTSLHIAIQQVCLHLPSACYCCQHVKSMHMLELVVCACCMSKRLQQSAHAVHIVQERVLLLHRTLQRLQQANRVCLAGPLPERWQSSCHCNF